jgi:septum formation protein
MYLTKIILGSSSRYRRKIMDRLGLPYEVLAADLDEKTIRDSDPRELTLRLGRAKAEAVRLRLHAPAIIITSDEVAVYNGVVREKPAGEEEAWRFLVDYERGPLQTYASLVVTDTSSGRQLTDVDVVTVRFGKIPDERKHSAIRRGDILSCCGGFATDDPDLAPYLVSVVGKRADQENADSAIGLPTRLLRKFLRELNAPLP